MLKKLKFCCGIILSALFLYASLQMINFREMYLALSRTNYYWVSVTALSMLLSFLSRGYLSRKILRPVKEIPLSTAFGAVVVGNMANNILPFRLGELARAYFLGRAEQIGVSTILSAILMERLLDIIILVILFTLSLPLVPWEGSVVLKVLILTAITVGLLAVLLITFRRSSKCFKSFHGLIISFWLGVLSWFWWSLAIAATLLALDIQGQLYAMTLVLMVVLNLAVLLPSSPGSIGIFQFAAIYGLKMFGINSSEAFSLSIVFQGINYLLTIGLGALVAWQGKVNIAALWKMSKEAQTVKRNL
ncbi:MAG: lysylphosphatidylglycerol synthase transmembrane domain-containing protein [Carboxydocellales bacterium]